MPFLTLNHSGSIKTILIHLKKTSYLCCLTSADWEGIEELCSDSLVNKHKDSQKATRHVDLAALVDTPALKDLVYGFCADINLSVPGSTESLSVLISD